MAINYTTLFTKLGKLIAKSNSLESLQATTLPADLASIISTYGTTATTTGTAQEAVEGLHSSYRGIYSSIQGTRLAIASFATSTIFDYDLIISQLIGLSNPSLEIILAALIQDMLDNNQTVVRSTTTIGSITTYSSNIGNGTILIDKQLDGYNSPAGGIPHIRYVGLDSELAPPNVTHYWECVADSYADGTNEGQESFSWSDGVSFGTFDIHSEGIGQGPSLQVASDSGIVANGNFTTFTNNTPTSWSIVSGAAGTTIKQSTTTYYRGASALQFTGNGSTTLKISQSISKSLLQPRRRYLLTIRTKRDGTTPTSGKLNIYFQGTGYSPSAGEEIEVDAANISTNWELRYFYWTTPPSLPSDLKLFIEVNTKLTSGSNIYFDSLTFTPVVYHGGVNAVVIPGSTPFCRGDRLRCTVTSSEGIIQKWTRRYWNVQWPSAASTAGAFVMLLPYSLFTTNETATISDSLAT
jgi:hypothetical protein